MRRSTMSLILGSLVALAAANASAQSVLYVNADAMPNGDGLSWDTAFDDLQDALVAAAGGGGETEEVWVAAGIYLPGEVGETDATFELLNGLALYGGFDGAETMRGQRDPGANETILSGDLGLDDVYGQVVWYEGWLINTDNSAHVVTASGVDATAVLDGFTVMAGYTTFAGGGGLLVNEASPMIQNCRFWRDFAGFAAGGAVLVIDGSPGFINCVFNQNYVHLSQGGAMYLFGASEVTIDGCGFTENISVGSATGGWTAGAAIAISTDFPATIRRTNFEHNDARPFWPVGDDTGTYAGAIYHGGTAPLTVDACRFIDNSSNFGGAIYSWGDLTVANSLFADNVAPEYDSVFGWGGGGGAIAVSSFGASDVAIVNSVFVNNDAEDSGGVGLYGDAMGTVDNSILWGNTDKNGSIGSSQVSGPDVSYSCIENMLVGEPGEDPPDPADFPGCIDEDPIFADINANDFHLSPGSPCIDAGNNEMVPAWVEVDLDGNDRFVDDPDTADTGSGNAPFVDMGAYEYAPSGGVTGDLDGDGIVGTTDLLIMLGAWGPCGDCADCIADLDGDCVVGTTDLLILLGNWG